MPYQNSWEGNGLYRLFTGTISGQEIIQSNLELHGDARFYDIEFIVNDFTQITEFQFSEMELTSVVALDNVATMSKHTLKIAIVATHEALLKWISEYCKLMEESPYQCKIFDNLDDAFAWGAAGQ